MNIVDLLLQPLCRSFHISAFHDIPPVVLSKKAADQFTQLLFFHFLNALITMTKESVIGEPYGCLKEKQTCLGLG